MAYTPNDIYDYIIENDRESEFLQAITLHKQNFSIGEITDRRFLVHAYPENMKSQFDEEILKEVLRYMIMMTIVRLRLDTPEKVEEYLGSRE